MLINLHLFYWLMLYPIECPTPAYQRLKAAGIDRTIVSKRKIIEDIFLYNSICADNAGVNILNHAEKEFFAKDRLISDRSEMHKNILELEAALKESDNPRFDEFKEMLIKYPSFLAACTIGENVLRFEQFGFPSRKSFEEAIASFCIGEEESINSHGSDYIWRNGNFKHLISQNIHGDMYASQTDVSGKEYAERTLFGDVLLFDTVKINPEVRAISAYQDWSQFLVSLLKYAQLIEKQRMPEITEWREVLKETGEVYTPTAEAMFGDRIDDWRLDFLLDCPVLTSDTTKLEEMPLYVFSSKDTTFMPYVEGRNLVYLHESKDGDFEIPFQQGIFQGKKYSKRLEYTEEDLPHALRATYKLFARDRRILSRIMDKFLSKELVKEQS